MKQALWLIPSKCEVELTFTTNPNDVIDCDSDIWGRWLAECWVKFPEFLLKACKGFEQTLEGGKFLGLLASMTGENFDPEVVYWTISTHQANPIKLTASRKEICSVFGICEMNNRYIKAISVPREYVCEDEEDVYKWFIIITHDSFSETISKIVSVILGDIWSLIDEILTEICRACRNFILFIGSLIHKFLDCLFALLLLILAVIGELIMRINGGTSLKDRPNSQFRIFNLFLEILDYLRNILDKLNILDAISLKLTILNEKVDDLNLNFSSSTEINMQRNEINYNRLEELIRENERLKMANNFLQEQAEIKDKIINRQKEYIEKSVEEIEWASKIMSSKESDKGKFSVEEIGKLCGSFKEMLEKAGSVINQTNHDWRGSKHEGITNVDSKNNGKQTGIENKQKQSPKKNQ